MKRYLTILICTLCAKAALALTPVIIDTDLGPDDWGALPYLLQQKNIDIKAITVAGDGETNCQAGIKYLSAALAFWNRADIPIACGSDYPLRGHNVFPHLWRYNTLHLYGLHFPASNNKVTVKPYAPTLILNTLKQVPGKVIFIELAPMTNLAIALKQNPKLVNQKIKRIYFTGGDFRPFINSGVTTFFKASHDRYASWNTYVDPVAAKLVFLSQIPITLNSRHAQLFNGEPLFQAVLTSKHLNAMGQFIRAVWVAKPVARFIADQSTAVLAMHPDLCIQTKNMPVKVLSMPAYRAGVTMPAEDGVIDRVCMKINVKQFFKTYLSALLTNKKVQQWQF